MLHILETSKTQAFALAGVDLAAAGFAAAGLAAGFAGAFTGAFAGAAAGFFAGSFAGAFFGAGFAGSDSASSDVAAAGFLEGATAWGIGFFVPMGVRALAGAVVLGAGLEAPELAAAGAFFTGAGFDAGVESAAFFTVDVAFAGAA